MCCIVKCGECEFWDNSYRYCDSDTEVYGRCKSDKFNYCRCNVGETDNLIYADEEGIHAGFDTGKDYGCIHGIKKQSKEEGNMIEKHLGMLGKKATDRVTGYSGVIASISFDLYGCVQVVITPAVDEKGELKIGNWFDIARIVITDDIPVMDPPNFQEGYVAEGKSGAADKPLSLP